MKRIKLIKKGDLLVIAVIAAIALILFIPTLSKKEYLTASVYADGKIIREIDLNAVEKTYTFSPKEGTEIEVSHCRIRFCSAVCRDRLCVSSGWLDRNGQTAACLPEKIVICIKGSDNAPDMLTY